MTLTSSISRLQSISSHVVSTTTNALLNHSSKQLSKPIIAFIGGGNMAEAILCGLQSSGHPSSYLRYSEPFEQRLEYMQTKYPDMIGSNKNKEVIEGADVIVLAVKPQILHTVVTELGSLIEHNPEVLVLSIAAGITTEDIQAWIHAPFSPCIVRCMPNTPALIGEGAVGLYATEHVSHEQKKMTEDIMKAVSKQVIWVHEESLIDAVTGISGSGPAYFFLIMEAMQNAGIQAGLSSKDAKALTLQTCLGAARMAQISEDDLSTLRCKVTSPKGTTEAAIHSMESNQIRKVMSEAVFSAKRRSKELAEQIGKEL